MKLNLYDRAMNRIAIIEGRFVSCMWSEGYNTTQPFTLELLATQEYKEKVKPDCYVGRDDRKTMMVIKTVLSKAGHIIASGKQAARCLDDVACEAILPENTVIASGLKAAYDTGDKFENIEFEETDTGFRVVRSGKKLLTQFYKPVANPNRILSEQYGNLKVESVTLSTENLKNHAIVLGEGEGEERFRVYVDLSGGAQKRSMFVDARDILREEEETDESYSARLYARGVEKLLEQKGTWECAWKPLAREFGTLYDLGDVITVLLPDYGMKLQTRITRFTQQSQNNRHHPGGRQHNHQEVIL